MAKVLCVASYRVMAELAILVKKLHQADSWIVKMISRPEISIFVGLQLVELSDSAQLLFACPPAPELN